MQAMSNPDHPRLESAPLLPVALGIRIGIERRLFLAQRRGKQPLEVEWRDSDAPV